MIYIGTTNFDGRAIYFDIYSHESASCALNISGTIGDGFYEGEVLIELGKHESVTFADEWLGGQGFSEFLSRCDVSAVKQSLIDSVYEISDCSTRLIRRH